MNTFPLVSIIIPIFNREKIVGKTLQSIFDNNYRPIELILIDDGSTDNSLNALNTFMQQKKSDNFIIKVFSQENKGAPAARNLGYSNSEGEYIQFLDSDDFISEDKFIYQLDLIMRENADFALCDFEMKYVDEGDRIQYHSNEKKIKKVLKAHGSFGCGSPLIHRTIAEKISWDVNLRRNQDVDYFLKAALLAKKIVHIDKPLYTYIRHSGDRISATYSNTAPVYLERIKSLKRLFKYKYNRINILKALLNLYLRQFKYVWFDRYLYENKYPKLKQR